MKKIALLMLFFTTLAPACKKHNALPDFEGITTTDINGIKLSTDSDDWNFNDDWLDVEKALFPNDFGICVLQNEIFDISAYPNPVNVYQNYRISTPQNCTIYMRLVDKNFNILMSEEFQTYALTQLTFDFSEFSNEDKIRMYYKVVYNNCELKGHGDIQFN